MCTIQIGFFFFCLCIQTFPSFPFFITPSRIVFVSMYTVTHFVVYLFPDHAPPPITKQTSQIEQIPLHFRSSWLMPRGLQPMEAAAASYVRLTTLMGVGDSCNGADLLIREHRCPTNLSILCASHTNRATAFSGEPWMKNNTQMAANGLSAGENLEQTTPTHL